MTDVTLDAERYPIGKFKPTPPYSAEDIADFVSHLQAFPEKLAAAVSGLSEKQLDTSYRDGGWTIRQVVHHLADSHMNAYIRIKWALTESTPIIKAYNEKAWAETPETKLAVDFSIELLRALHKKIVALAQAIDQHDLGKSFIHPDTKKEISIGQLLGLYAWHGNHHLAHVTSLKTRKNW